MKERPSTKAFDEAYAAYCQERDARLEGRTGLSRISAILVSQHDAYGGSNHPLTRRAYEESQAYGEQLRRFYDSGEREVDPKDVVILSNGLFAHRRHPTMYERLEQFALALQRAEVGSQLKIELVAESESVFTEVTHDWPRQSREERHQHKQKRVIMCGVPYWQGWLFSYSVNVPQVISVRVKNFLESLFPQPVFAEQKPLRRKGPVPIPLEFILGDDEINPAVRHSMHLWNNGVLVFEQPGRSIHYIKRVKVQKEVHDEASAR